jgi:peptide/nickel transport system permease protein
MEERMGAYVLRRFLYMILLVALSSVASFTIIQLPPGDYLTSYIAQLQSQGQEVNAEEIEGMRRAYGLDQPEYMQYIIWVRKIVTEGDMGRSFQWRQPVSTLIMERLPATLLVSFGAMLIVYTLAIPIGTYSATRQYSIGDYIFTIIGFLGLATPSFVLALILMVFFYTNFGVSVGGLVSPGMESAPWGWPKIADLLAHLPVPLIVIGLTGTASIIRIMRATLLDELNKPYVETARAKGLSEGRLLFKYPLRIALNPIASTAGWLLPAMFSGSTIVAIVLNLPTIGPLLYNALLTEDMFLAGGTVLISTVLTVVGTFLSDMILVWLDPRIRLEHAG